MEKIGLLVDFLDEERLFNAVQYLLTHSDEAKMMGMSGYEKVKNYFNWDATAERFIERGVPKTIVGISKK